MFAEIRETSFPNPPQRGSTKMPLRVKDVKKKVAGTYRSAKAKVLGRTGVAHLEPPVFNNVSERSPYITFKQRQFSLFFLFSPFFLLLPHS